MKKKLAVRLEGTLVNAEWQPIQEAVDWLKLLQDDFEITIVSVEAGSTAGLRRVFQVLADFAIPYDEVWASFCLPPHDVYFDANAVTKWKNVK